MGRCHSDGGIPLSSRTGAYAQRVAGARGRCMPQLAAEANTMGMVSVLARWLRSVCMPISRCWCCLSWWWWQLSASWCKHPCAGAAHTQCSGSMGCSQACAHTPRHVINDNMQRNNTHMAKRRIKLISAPAFYTRGELIVKAHFTPHPLFSTFFRRINAPRRAGAYLVRRCAAKQDARQALKPCRA